jgi:hypothetical protein
MFESPHLRRAMTAVLVAVGAICAAVLLLGDRFGAARSYATTRVDRVHGAHIAACVAEESMRLIDIGRERCGPGELMLVPPR